MDEREEMHRVRWQCRRGMLELDLLLSCFLENGYKKLNKKEKDSFLRLLGRQDQIIQDWLMGHAVPADAQLRDLVRRIRDATIEE